MKTFFIFVLAIFSFTFAQDELFNNANYQKFFYLGTVNNNQVQMILELRGNEIIGSYYYNLIGAPIELRGEQSGEETNTGFPLTVNELDENGKAVAKFEGELSSGNQGTNATFHGTWTCAECASPEPKVFKLERVAEFAQVTLQQNFIETALTYPVFSGTLAPFNKAVNQDNLVSDIWDSFQLGQEDIAASDLYYAWSAHTHYTVNYASENLVSLLETGDWYTGGAHPNYGFAGHNFLRQNDEVEVLGFRDLFTNDADLSTIATFVKDDLMKQEASLIPDDFGVETLDSSAFTLSPKGITFHFAPYQVGSYAEGDYEVTIPFEEVKDMLRPEIASEFLG